MIYNKKGDPVGRVFAGSAPDGCGMKGCDNDVHKTLSIIEHQDLREDLGLPEKVKELKVCAYHAAMWEIGWILADLGYPINVNGVKKALAAIHITPNTSPYL